MRKNQSDSRVATPFSTAALNLILEFEGMDQPDRWPGEDSGITIGHGYDLGFTSAAQFQEDWGPLLSDDVYDRLLAAIAIKGTHARDVAPRFAGIVIRRADADTVFFKSTLPHWHQITRGALPGFDRLPLDAQGALVSLFYNRGPSYFGDSRREMRAVRDLAAQPCGANLAMMAAQVRAMKRLWAGKGMCGLLRRRDAEAALIAQA